MSADLQWLLLRKWNSFQHKSGNGPVLSREKGNLLNLHSHKYSGLANAKVINIYGNTEGGISITTVKKDAKPTQVAGARSHVNLRRSTAARRANKIAAAETAGKGYRADLRPAAVARASALSRVIARTANPQKERAQKTQGLRASKKSAAAAGKTVGEQATKEDEDVIELD